MKKWLTFLLFTVWLQPVQAQWPEILFEKTNGKQSPEYAEIIRWWQQLDQQSPYVKMMEMGPTDAGFPLHLVLISADKNFSIPSLKKKDKRIIFILNGIHPGEPDGIDASMVLVRNILNGFSNRQHASPADGGRYPATRAAFDLPENTVLALIPVYNIGGCLNRSANYRIDQNGPEEKGFRGNSQNLDLNRDFIKCDSREARTFTRIFHLLDPDVFIDNHVSDGADYQHIMTLISTQHNKLGGGMGDYLQNKFEPALYQKMSEKGFQMVPYVNSFGDTPESGWPEFWDSPRYSSGYAALWQTFSFVPETHMLKPYADRVNATRALMESFISYVSEHSQEIRDLRNAAMEAVKKQTSFPIAWALNKDHFREITFLGYEAGRKPSEVSGLPRLYYDRTKPFSKQVKIFNDYEVKRSITAPKAYLIPQGWWKVTDLLKLNGVEMQQLKKDTQFNVMMYHLADYKSSSRPYEMHHANSELQFIGVSQILHARAGDWYIPVNQRANRFLVETLEPMGEDSYFTWNFFDGILGQKEGYSGYSFEDIAATYLKTHPALQKMLEDKRATDSVFRNDGRAQLNYVYQHSDYFETNFMNYPVYRVE